VSAPVRPPLRQRVAWLADGELDVAVAVHLERRRVRCGKSRCRCAKGDRHGPYLYLRFRESATGRRRRVYVPERLLRTVTGWIGAFRAQRDAMRYAMSLVYRLYGR